MVVLKFVLSKVGNDRTNKVKPKYTVIENNCEGFIVQINGIYKVKYKDKIYSITTESYDSNHRKTIYARWKDKFGHRIKIIRDVDNRKPTNIKHYCAICDGLICKGKLVNIPLQGTLFHIRVCYNPADVEGTSLALKEWLSYKERLNNGEIDETQEL